MSALSDDMKAELDQLPPHWRVHGKIQSWLGRVRELEQAADPDLLGALSGLLDEAEDVFVCMADATGIDRKNFPEPFRRARAAIARAEGR